MWRLLNLKILKAILKQSCPRCLRGQVFSGWIEMHTHCPGCGLHFEREQGYFLGAMYISYGIGIVLVSPVAVLMYLSGIDSLWIGSVASLQLVVFSPLLFRFARIIWMHFDQVFDPR